MFSSFFWRRLSVLVRAKRHKLAEWSADRDRRRLLMEELESRRVLAALAIAALDAIKLEGNSGSTPFTFTVSRDTTATTSSVNFSVTGSGTNQAAASDFFGGVLPTGTVNFAVGETTKTITINVAGDALFEPNEGFTVTLSNPSAGDTISTAQAVGRIDSDDGATISISANNADRLEGNFGSTIFSFTITRGGNISRGSSVRFDVTGSGANPATGADFIGGGLPSGTVNFSANETTKTVNISVVGDVNPEPDQTFTVTLSNVSSGDRIGTATAGGRIRNDDGTAGIATLAIAAASADKFEGSTGNTSFTFTVTRGGDLNHASSVAFAVTGSGTNPATGADFVGGVLPTGTVNFLAGETSKTITVSVVGDTTAEPNEGFTVTLSNASPPDAITTASATGTIQDDDGGVAPATLAIAAASADKPEGTVSNSFFTFTITRSGDLNHATTVDVTVTGSGINPASGADFSGGAFPFGTVTFAVGESIQQITITVAGDSALEPDEGFAVTLSNPSTPDAITTATALSTIRNDDFANPGDGLGVATSNLPRAPRTAVVVPDQDNPGQTALIVTGTAVSEGIVVEPQPGQPSQIRVRFNSTVVGIFNASSVQTIVVFGRAGNDTLVINSALSIDALLFGQAGDDRLFGALGADGLDGGAGRDVLFGMAADDELEGGLDADDLRGGSGNDQLLGLGGNDQLHGEAGHDILLGGEGNDSLFGLDGRDLLIGGGGSDVLAGGAGGDVLIGGSTTHESSQAALLAILAELQSSSDYLTRVNNLRFGGGANGDVVLNASTIVNDGIADRSWGGGGLDWFITGPGDGLLDRVSNERVN